MNILIITKVISFIFLIHLVVLFLVYVNKNKIYMAGFNLSLMYLFLLIFDVYDSFSIIPSLIIGIPYIIGLAVFICGILDFDGLRPLIAHISSIW